MKNNKLPEGWQEVELGELVEIIAGQAPPSESYNKESKGLPFLRVNSFREKYPVNDSWTTESLKTCEKGDILLSVAGTIGTVNIADKKYSITRSIFALRILNKKLDSLYLFHFLKTLEEKLKYLGTGSSQKIITIDTVAKTKIPLPLLATQKKIVQILEKSEKLKQNREDADKLTKDYLRSVFYEMFDKYLKDKKNYIKIEEFASKDKNAIKAGPFGSSLKKECYVPNGYKIYGQEQVIKDDLNFGDYYISKEKYKELENYKVQEGDILISLVGTYGKISIVPKKFSLGIINPRLMKISLDQNKMIPIFFKYLFLSTTIRTDLENVSHGGTMDIVNVGIIKKILFPLPPLPLQQKFVKIVEQVEKLKEKQQKLKEKIDEMFNSLMQRAFNGELVK